MLLIKGVNVFPSAILDVVAAFKPSITGAIRIVKTDSSPVVEPPLVVRVEYAEGAVELPQPRERITEEISRRLRFRADIQLEAPGTLGFAHGATHKQQLVEIQ